MEERKPRGRPPKKPAVSETAKPRAKQSPLVKALIAEIPNATEPWPSDRREAWLDMMRRSFDVVWGCDLYVQQPEKPTRRVPQSTAKPVPKPPFYIDEHGAARNRKGDAILPSDVKGDIVDLRGLDGDVGDILWADGTTGLTEAGDLTITV